MVEILENFQMWIWMDQWEKMWWWYNLLLSTIYVGWKLRVEMCLEKSTKSSNDSFILLLLNLIYIVHFGSIVANWENFGPPLDGSTT